MVKEKLKMEEKVMLEELGLPKVSMIKKVALIQLNVFIRARLKKWRNDFLELPPKLSYNLIHARLKISSLKDKNIEAYNIAEIKDTIGVINKLIEEEKVIHQSFLDSPRSENETNNNDTSANEMNDKSSNGKVEEEDDTEDQEEDSDYKNRMENLHFNTEVIQNPIPINFLQLQEFDFTFFDLNEIVMFNYLVMVHNTIKREVPNFYHSVETFKARTNINRNIQERIFKRFQDDLKIISTRKEMKELHCRKYFTLNISNIIRLLPKIYRKGVDIEQMKDYYKSIEFAYKKSSMRKYSGEKNNGKKRFYPKKSFRPFGVPNSSH